MDRSFFDLPFENMDLDLFERMSINGWLEEIFFPKDEFNWIAN
jgi:hypothetical protein